MKTLLKTAPIFLLLAGCNSDNQNINTALPTTEPTIPSSANNDSLSNILKTPVKTSDLSVEINLSNYFDIERQANTAIWDGEIAYDEIKETELSESNNDDIHTQNFACSISGTTEIVTEKDTINETYSELTTTENCFVSSGRIDFSRQASGPDKTMTVNTKVQPRRRYDENDEVYVDTSFVDSLSHLTKISLAGVNGQYDLLVQNDNFGSVLVRRNEDYKTTAIYGKNNSYFTKEEFTRVAENLPCKIEYGGSYIVNGVETENVKREEGDCLENPDFQELKHWNDKDSTLIYKIVLSESTELGISYNTSNGYSFWNNPYAIMHTRDEEIGLTALSVITSGDTHLWSSGEHYLHIQNPTNAEIDLFLQVQGDNITVEFIEEEFPE